MLRFRPILMTTMAALLAGGARPRCSAPAPDRQNPPAARLYHRRRPLPLPQIMTLFTTPVVYLYLDQLNSFLTRRGGKRVNKKAGSSLLPH